MIDKRWITEARKSLLISRSPFRGWLDEERAQNPKIFMSVFLISGLYGPKGKAFCLFLYRMN